MVTYMKSVLILLITGFAANFYLAGTPDTIVESNNDLDSLKSLIPKNYYMLEGQLVHTVLDRYHYKQFELNDSLSSVIFDRYLKSVDYRKNYLLESDIKSFEQYRYALDDHLKDGDVLPFYDMFNVFLFRMRDQIIYTDTLLSKEFDYTIDEEYLINRKDAPWAESKTELDDIWRKRVKNDALNLKLNDKEWEEIQKNLKKRYENYSRILTQYNSEDVFQLAMNSFTTSVDPHTNYLSPITSDNFKIDMSLSLEGIGARLQVDDGYTKVVEIIPGGPAFKSKKLHADDRITAVAQGENGDFVDVVGWRITDVVQLIRGPKDSVVRLLLLKYDKGLDAEPVELILVRDKVKIEDQSASSSTLNIKHDEKTFKIGVITIPKFYIDFEAKNKREKDYKSTSRDVKNLLNELIKENVDGIIIDLRNDGGGSLEEAIRVTGLFIKEGPVVQVRDMEGNITVDNDLDPEIVYDGPLAVLVNRFSASASEIFSGAIQDYGRGIIIGENTYGKGTVQNMIDLSRLTSRANKFGQVKLTIAKYYRVDGSSTQRMGVIPDILFPSYVDAKDFGESNEPSALKWDKIEPAEYELFYELFLIIPELQKLSKQRRETDLEFEYFREDIDEYNKSIKDKYVSLNEDVRRKEKEEREEKSFQRENERRKIKGLRLLDKGETPPEDEKLNDDPFLNESAHIIADFISLTIG
ncbi:MAG: tail-specific protease [Ignavibacteria bacterium]|nr:MAG: tail-specific protease [Ignavibacteria bacterium]